MKTCRKCNKTKRIKDFYKRADSYNTLSYCKPCHKAEYKTKNDAQKSKSYLKIKYGLTVEKYASLVEEQNGLCAICLKPSLKKLNVDHDHNTGKIRGLLCGDCNRGLGLFKDDSERLVRASVYLAKQGVNLQEATKE